MNQPSEASDEHQGQAQEKGREPRDVEEGWEGNVSLPSLFLKARAGRKASFSEQQAFRWAYLERFLAVLVFQNSLKFSEE